MDIYIFNTSHTQYRTFGYYRKEGNNILFHPSKINTIFNILEYSLSLMFYVGKYTPVLKQYIAEYVLFL